ncbi:hypothetical protein HYR99_41060, partial [Candidatus Poribacteria bacterium]|nr:hypothetical protein [Candidatus Poribacteria bacterium]
MAKDHPDIVQRALRMKKIGNDVMILLGGREIHPINVRVGGFYKVPTKRALESLTEDLKWGQDAAIETVKWVATLPFPEFERNYEFVAIRYPDEYAIIEGQLVSNRGINTPSEGVQGTAVCGVFEMTIASTGASEKTLRRLGMAYEKVYLYPGHHVRYYPGAKPIAMKLLFSPADGLIPGAQA